MLKRLTILLGVLLMLSCLTSAQTLTIDTYGVSPRTAGLDEADIFEYPFSGLTNVGVGTMVYFKVEADQAFENLTWTLPVKPDGSSPSFGKSMTEGDMIVYRQFTPDLSGHYVIEVSDFSGVIASVEINAAMYLGYNNTENPNCLNCHNNSLYGYIGDKWEGTGHYSDTERAFNGELSSHFRESCLECHATGYDANPTAVNGGFDDYEFVYPDSLYPGQWDNLFQQYPEAMSMARIQCEACHGPGGNHYGQTGNAAMVTSIEESTCGVCHDEGTHHNFPQQWDLSVHATGSTYARGSSTSCAQCHSGAGFVAWVKNDQQPLAEAPDPTHITCATCHNPHDASNAGQLRLVSATLANGYQVPLANEGRLCMNCHQARRDAVDYTNNYLDNLSSHYGPHHGPQGDVLTGQNAVTWGYAIGSSPHLQAIEKACVGCHMGEGPVDPDGNFELAGGHTFSMFTPDGQANVAVCEPCHGDIGETFTEKKLYINGIADHDGDGVDEGLQEEVEGLLEELHSLLPEDGITDSSVTLVQAQAYYNWDMIEEDRSKGMHNPEFAVELLKLTIGVVKGEISDVAPEDGQIPVSFELAQNYPNPFNPTTTIRFSIPKASNVTLTVYDAIGREVAKLVDEQMSSGTYSVDWNASNNASGIYFYRITTDNNVQVKKMVLVK